LKIAGRTPGSKFLLSSSAKASSAGSAFSMTPAGIWLCWTMCTMCSPEPGAEPSGGKASRVSIGCKRGEELVRARLFPPTLV